MKPKPDTGCVNGDSNSKVKKSGAITDIHRACCCTHKKRVLLVRGELRATRERLLNLTEERACLMNENEALKTEYRFLKDKLEKLELSHNASVAAAAGGSQCGTEDSSPADDGEDETLNIKVQDVDNSVMHFTIHKRMPFSKLMRIFCKKKKIPVKDGRFMIETGNLQRLVNLQTSTPESMNLKDGDTIHAFRKQEEGP